MFNRTKDFWEHYKKKKQKIIFLNIEPYLTKNPANTSSLHYFRKPKKHYFSGFFDRLQIV